MCRLSFGRSLPSLLCGCWRRLVHCLRHTIGCRTGSPFWETRFWLYFSQLRRHRERVGVRRGDGQASLRRQCYHLGLPHPLPRPACAAAAAEAAPTLLMLASTHAHSTGVTCNAARTQSNQRDDVNGAGASWRAAAAGCRNNRAVGIDEHLCRWPFSRG